MRPFLLSTLLLILLPACREAGEDGAQSDRLPSSEALSSSGTLTPPEPGQLEDFRARTDPGVDLGAGEPQDPPGDMLVAFESVGPDEGSEDPSEGASGEEGSDDRASEEDGARFPRPRYVRGIYLNAWTAGSRRRRARLVDMVRRTELNTVVIDIKDASGYVSHDSQVPLAREAGATEEVRIDDLPGLLNQLQEAGIYPIARIVVAKDPILAEARPDLAIQDSAGGVWRDHNEVEWLNLHHPEVWEYHLQLAREVVRAGFPEVQWDYVRFPDAPESYLARAVYPEGDGKTKAQAVRGFLGHAREALEAEGARVTVDVFGVTTSYSRDVGIGQLWESFIDQVDVALPMVYPSHYWTGSFGFTDPNSHPYEIVRQALRDAVRRSSLVEGAGLTRPWLQDFSLGDPPYGSPEVRAQIQATYDAGIQEWILWNPASRYTEAALIPARGLPSWLEPVMRVGGEVVGISKRFSILGEADGLAPGESGSVPVREDPAVRPPTALPHTRALPRVPIPDTTGVGSLQESEPRQTPASGRTPLSEQTPSPR